MLMIEHNESANEIVVDEVSPAAERVMHRVPERVTFDIHDTRNVQYCDPRVVYPLEWILEQ